MFNKAALLFAVFLMSAGLASGAGVKDEKGVKDLADQVMDKVVLDDLDGAFSALRTSAMWPAEEWDKFTQKTKSERAQYKQTLGESSAYEFIDIKKAGESLLRLRYVEKCSKHPVEWTFYFYKYADVWGLESLFWKTTYTDMFDSN